MAKRADQVEETRQRIIEATVRLHQQIGLRATSIAAVAAEAGVTRLTVYRHFPDEPQLFAACSRHWLSQQRLPDPSAWAQISEPKERLKVGLTDIYRFYRHGNDMLTSVYADIDLLPTAIRENITTRDAAFVAVLAEPLQVRPTRLLRAALGHAVSYLTWRSLCLEQSLTNAQAVELMRSLSLAAASGPAAGLDHEDDAAHRGSRRRRP